MAEEGTGVKREFRIDSSDSARPAATLQSEPHYYAQGLKPKPRVLVDVIYEDTGEVAKTTKGKPVKLILKTKVFDDGTTIDCTVGEENPEYQEFLRTGSSIPSQSAAPTRQRKPSAQVEAAKKKAAAKKGA